MHFIIRARDAHLALIAELKAAGHALFGAAMLDDSGKMIGSTLLVDFPSRVEVDAWLKREPYVVEKVWQAVDVTPCAIAPAFKGLFG